MGLKRLLKSLLSWKKTSPRHEPTVRDVAAAGLFLSNFYNGIENILRRLCHFYDVEVPTGETWHIELVRSFCQPPRQGLPGLFDDCLALDLAPFRRFRHVIHHGYGAQLRWQDMRPGVREAPGVFVRFRVQLMQHLDSLGEEDSSS